jgi:hypothetical protein
MRAYLFPLLVVFHFLTASADEFRSPNGAYTVVVTTPDGSAGGARLLAKGERPRELGDLWTFEVPGTKAAVFWSPDSVQVAIYAEAQRFGETKVFQVGNNRFHEFAFPEITVPALAAKTKDLLVRSVYEIEKPVRWNKRRHLLVLKEGRVFLPGDPEKWIDYSAEVTLAFDLKDDGSVVSLSKISVKEKAGLK